MGGYMHCGRLPLMYVGRQPPYYDDPFEQMHSELSFTSTMADYQTIIDN